MRILQLTKQVPYPLHSGESIAIGHMADMLLKVCHGLYLFTFNTSRHYVSTADPKLRSYLQKYKAVKIKEIDTTIRASLLIKNLLFDSRSIHLSRFDLDETSLIDFVNEHSIDILWAESLFMMPLVLKVKASYPSIKIVYRSHNIEHRVWQRWQKGANWLSTQYIRCQAERLKTEEYALVKRASGIVSISPIDALFFSNLIDAPPILTVTSHFLFKKKPPTNYNKEELLLGFIGAMDWRPNQQGVEWFISQILPHLDTAIRICIAGRAAESLSTKDLRVINLGSVSDEERDQFYKNVDLIILPILAGSGIRIKALEAIAYGLPMVSTLIGVEGLELNSSTDYFEANTKEQWIKTLNKLVKNREELYTRATHAQKQVAKLQLNSKEKWRELASFLDALD